MPSLPDLETPGLDDARTSLLLARTFERSTTMTASRRRRRRFGTTAGVLAVAATVLLATLVGGSAPRRPVRELGAFALVGELSPVWRAASTVSGVSGFSLACPSTATCFASDQSAPGDAVQVTHDGGTTWETRPLPDALVAASTLSCPTASDCAILGVDASGAARLVRTTDGGATWTASAGPAALTDPAATIALACSDATTCAGIASAPAAPDPLAFTTVDGGASWQAASAPVGFVPTSLRCASTARCVATGFDMASSDAASPSGVALSSRDGGATWTVSAVPRGLGARSALSCATASACVAAFFDGASDGSTAVLGSTDGGATWGVLAGADLQLVTGLSCPTSLSCTAGGVALSSADGSQPQLVASGGSIRTTDDGGRSFTAAALPPGTTAVLSVSCPGTTACFALALDDGSTDGSPPSFALLAAGPAASA